MTLGWRRGIDNVDMIHWTHPEEEFDIGIWLPSERLCKT